MVQNSGRATLADEVCPIYRPDLAEIAYFEFEVIGLKSTSPRGHKGRSSQTGFILVSTGIGKHDVPIPHLSLDVEPPSRALETMSGDGVVARVYRIDALSYLAEGPDGEELARIGQFPLKVAGKLDPNAALSVVATPKTTSKTDSKRVEYEVSKEGSEDFPKLTGWKSWAELKAGYAAHYKGMLEAMAQYAAHDWEVEELISKSGEGIAEGGQLAVAMLEEGAATVSGPGASFIKMDVSRRAPWRVVLKALKPDAIGEQSFDLKLDYGKAKETLRFFILPEGTPSNSRTPDIKEKR